MENTENNQLGGGPPSPELEQEQAKRVSDLTAALERESAGPTSPSTPQQIERADLLEYKLLGERAQRAELQITMYHRELQRSQTEASVIAHEARNFMKSLETKYSFDMNVVMVTEDGYLVPRPLDLDQRASQMRK